MNTAIFILLSKRVFSEVLEGVKPNNFLFQTPVLLPLSFRVRAKRLWVEFLMLRKHEAEEFGGFYKWTSAVEFLWKKYTWYQPNWYFQIWQSLLCISCFNIVSTTFFQIYYHIVDLIFAGQHPILPGKQLCHSPKYLPRSLGVKSASPILNTSFNHLKIYVFNWNGLRARQISVCSGWWRFARCLPQRLATGRGNHWGGWSLYRKSSKKPPRAYLQNRFSGWELIQREGSFEGGLFQSLAFSWKMDIKNTT